jgi:hypothetical protein
MTAPIVAADIGAAIAADSHRGRGAEDRGAGRAIGGKASTCGG